MSTQLIVAAVVIVLILVIVVVHLYVPYKILWLIGKVSPFEQTVSGAPTVLVLGDSTGYGTGAASSEDSIAGRIGSDFAVTIQNNSVNGRTIGELLTETENIAGSYELILLQIGANDILQERNQQTVEDELQTLVARLLPHTNHLVMMSSGNVGASPKFNEEEAKTYTNVAREFRTVFQAVAEDTELTYIDLFVEPEDDAFTKNPEKYMALDGLHPTSAGYAKWYQSMYPVIAPMLDAYKKHE